MDLQCGCPADRYFPSGTAVLPVPADLRQHLELRERLSRMRAPAECRLYRPDHALDLSRCPSLCQRLGKSADSRTDRRGPVQLLLGLLHAGNPVLLRVLGICVACAWHPSADQASAVRCDDRCTAGADDDDQVSRTVSTHRILRLPPALPGDT